MNYYFRFDDLSVNTDGDKFLAMVKWLREVHPGCQIMGAVSPCVFDTGNERVFPALLNRESDHSLFYHTDRCGVPDDLMSACDEVAAHGMAHVDHRLLDLSAQEMSIAMSCALVKTKVFVPPFHKFNSDTEQTCSKHRIKLVRLHDQMVHLGHHPVTADRNYYYLHTHDFTSLDEFKRRIKP